MSTSDSRWSRFLDVVFPTRNCVDSDARQRDLSFLKRFATLWLVAGALSTLWSLDFGKGSGAALLWSFASLASGGAVGFLFGIPRYAPSAMTTASDSLEDGDRPTSDPSYRYSPNSNLNDVSDWLTKIIVGLGLANLNSIPSRLWAMAHDAAPSLQLLPVERAEAVMVALLVGFSVLGFLIGYLFTRIYLQGAFIRGDDAREAIQRATGSIQDDNVVKADDRNAALATKTEFTTATQLGKTLSTLPDAGRQEALMQQRALALEYQQVRASMAPSEERTQRMYAVLLKMRALAVAARPWLKTLSRSDLPGERLAVVAMLQVKFSTLFIDWLADVCVNDAPFVGYHAAGALLAAARVYGEPDRSKLRNALLRAQEQLRIRRPPDEGRDKLIADALAEVGPVPPGESG